MNFREPDSHAFNGAVILAFFGANDDACRRLVNVTDHFASDGSIQQNGLGFGGFLHSFLELGRSDFLGVGAVSESDLGFVLPEPFQSSS